MNQKRPDDSDLIDDAQEPPAPSHQGSGGGGLARQVGKRDEIKNLAQDDPEPSRVRASDKPDDGDLPTPPQNLE